MSLPQVDLVVGFAPAIWLSAMLALAAFVLERRSSSRAGALLRAAIVWLAAAAIARPVLVSGEQAPSIVLVDRSASVDDQGLEERLVDVRRRLDDPIEQRFGDARASPMASAIDSALRLLPSGGRVVLLSDGRFSGPDPVMAASRAADHGVTVDVVAVPSRTGVDIAVMDLDAPATWRRGRRVPVRAMVVGTGPMSGTLRVMADDDVVTEATVSLGATRPVTIVETHVPTTRGTAVRITARVEADGDQESRNDEAHALTLLAPPPRVLVAGEEDASALVGQVLEASDIGVDTVTPDAIPSRLSELEPWDVLVLVDVSARQLGIDQMAAVEAHVAELGRGLVLTGGRQSYLLGGWETTPLERLAPVSLEPPPRGERDTVALLLLIDRSASMGTTDSATGISHLDLAREAASLSTEVLHPGDTVAVIAYDETARFIVPPTTVGEGLALAEIDGALAGIEASGGTRILAALEAALPLLAELEPPTRHAVLLSDGHDAEPDTPDYERVVRNARASATTLSTIAIGQDADRELLSTLARWGRGRYHSADDPSDLPRLTVEESEVLRARAEQTGDVRAGLPDGRAHAMLSGVDVGRLPSLGGYLAVSSRSEGDVALTTPDGDPLLASWAYGAGRVAAWTSDVGEVWARDWRDDPEARALWSRVVHYVAPAPGMGPPGVELTWDGLGVDVAVEAYGASGAAANLADVTLTITDDAGARVVALPQVAPGAYGAHVKLPDARPRPAEVRVLDADGAVVAKPVPLAPRPAFELAPGTAAEATLRSVAEAGGGRVMASTEALGENASARREIPLWPLLLGVAALLWPLDVARVVGFVPPSPFRQRKGGADEPA